MVNPNQQNGSLALGDYVAKTDIGLDPVGPTGCYIGMTSGVSHPLSLFCVQSQGRMGSVIGENSLRLDM